MSHHLESPETRIDQVLNALRTTDPPAGLEQRVAARIAQAAEARAVKARSATTSYFAVILSGARTGVPSGRSLPLGVESAQSKDPRILLAPARLYPIAAAITLLLTISTITILHHGTPSTAAHATLAQSTPTAVTLASSPSLEAPGLQPLRKSDLALKGRDFSPAANRQINAALAAEGISLASTPCFERAGLQSRRNALPCSPALAAEGISTRPRHASGSAVPQGFNLGSHNPTQGTPAPPDPDTLALAETLAPSHPAPPLPLTSQERLLQSATQRGAPIELAELDLAREPLLRAVAAAHEKSGLQQFVRSLVSQLVTSESLDPTPHNDTQTTPDPTSSSTNEPPTNGASPQ